MGLFPAFAHCGGSRLTGWLISANSFAFWPRRGVEFAELMCYSKHDNSKFFVFGSEFCGSAYKPLGCNGAGPADARLVWRKLILTARSAEDRGDELLFCGRSPVSA